MISPDRQADSYEFDPLGPALFPGRNTLRRLLRVSLYAALVLVTLAFLFPLAWMVMTALKSTGDVLARPPVWIPDRWHPGNFAETAAIIPIWRYAWNTLLIGILNVVGTVLSCSLVAYGFSRIQWPGRDALYAATLATLMIPMPLLLVPLYTMFLKAGWIGTFRPLWVPAFFGGAYYIFLLRQFFLTVPPDISDAARVDGAGEGRVFLQIVLPLSRPALIAVALFSFIFVWSDFMSHLVYLTDRDLYTFSLGLYEMHGRQRGSEINLLMAAATMMVAPVMVLFFAFQRTFLRGVTLQDFRT